MNSTNGNEYLYLINAVRYKQLYYTVGLIMKGHCIKISYRYCHIYLWACTDHYWSGDRAQGDPEYSCEEQFVEERMWTVELPQNPHYEVKSIMCSW